MKKGVALVIAPGGDDEEKYDSEEAPASESGEKKGGPKRPLIRALREALADEDDAAAERALDAFVSRCMEEESGEEE